MSEEKKPTLPTSEETEKCVQIFKAFGNDTRYRILYLLFEQALSVNEIVEAVGLTQSAVRTSSKFCVRPVSSSVCGTVSASCIIWRTAMS